MESTKLKPDSGGSYILQLICCHTMYDPKEREWPCLAEQVWWCWGSNDSVGTRSLNRAEPWLIHLLALWLLTSSLVCADLNFLIYEKTVVSTFYSTAIKTEWRNTSWESRIHPDSPLIWRFCIQNLSSIRIQWLEVFTPMIPYSTFRLE